jgi:hypothetical protein
MGSRSRLNPSTGKANGKHTPGKKVRVASVKQMLRNPRLGMYRRKQPLIRPLITRDLGVHHK